MLRDFAGKEMQILGVLQNPCALEVLRAMKPGCESEMPFEKGFGLTEDLENLFFWQFHSEWVLLVDDDPCNEVEER